MMGPGPGPATARITNKDRNGAGMTIPRLLSDRYELGETLGYGGMSEVHLGRDMRLDRDVAVKVLRADLARDPQFQHRFRREAQNAAALNHPAIVAVYDTGETVSDYGPLPYIVMEYVEGRTLRDIVKTEGPMDEQRAMETMADICAALDFSHRNGIIHRDVKPANVMINNAGAVKVMDFGAFVNFFGAKDGLVSDPAHCRFDPATLQCPSGDGPTCLTAAQVGAVKKIYSGPTNPRTGKRLYPGLYPGGEMGWAANTVINQTKKSGVSSYDFWGFAFYHKPDWPYPTFDFDKDVQRADEDLAPITNATSPNLEAFRKLGHKLIYYHGAADPLIPAQNGIDYFETVVSMEKGLANTQRFYRAFLVPGLYHCSGGPGPIAFGTAQPAPAGQRDADHDALRALERWVETDVAPARIIGTKYVDGDPAKGVAFQRPLCPYPEVAKYKGAGDMNDAASFACARGQD